jgi:hypothetical protein
MNRKRILFVVLIFFFVNQLQAGALLGADVRYRYLSGKKYEVCIALYRDCRGIPLSNPNNVYVYNDSFQIPLSLTRVKIEEVISPQCTGACVSNTTSGQGTEKHTYLDTIDFANGVYQKFGTQSRPLVYFAFDQCCRNGGITTYPPGNMFVEAMLNLYAANQNSQVVGFNDFNQSVEAYLYCQQTHNYSYRSNPYQTNDSLVYDMVRAKDDKTSEINYDPYKPMTYYCNSNPGNTNCLPNTTVNPVRGFFFNRSNGNLICTPGKCDELGTIVCKVGLYKKIGQSFVLMGYMKRDCNFIVLSNMGDDVPYIVKNKDYSIKAREKFCVDIPVKDDKNALQAQADTVTVNILKAPSKGSLNLLDSGAREKTLHYCWTPSDQDYLKKRSDEIEFRASQKKCLKLKVAGISTTIQFSVIAPDSICQVKVRTFEDRNKNGVKDGNEAYSKAKFFMDSKSIYTIYETDSLGQIILNPFYSKLSFGIPSQLDRYSSLSDKVLQTYFDSSYVLDLPYYKRYGIKGKVYSDKNSNCVFDAGDAAIANEKVFLKGSQRLAFTDLSGDYFIEAPSGNEQLEVNALGAYTPNCNAAYTVQMKLDTVQTGFDFPMSRKTDFIDLSVELLSKAHVKQNQVLLQNIKVSNRGNKTEKNVLIALNTSQKLLGFKSSKTTYNSADTIFWIADSIPANSSILIPFEFRLYKDSFLNNSLMCYVLSLRADSLNSNNQFKVCETFSDTILATAFKTSKNQYKVNEQDRSLTYKVSYSDKYSNHSYLVLTDSLEVSKFDLNSFRLMDNPNGFKVNLIDHVLYAEYYGNVSAGAEFGFVYSIDLKPEFKSAFMVYNAANWFADNNKTPQRTRTVNETESAIKIGLLSDSDYCLGDLIYLPISTLYVPNSNFKVYLSDSLGSFNNQTLILDTLVSKRNSVLSAKIPYAMSPGKGYKLKVVSDNPKTQSFEADFTQTLSFYGLPSVALSCNLVNGKICANDTLKFFATGADSIVYIYNTYQLGQFSATNTLNFVPSSNGKLQVATKDLNGCIAFSNEIPFAINALPNVKLLSNKELCSGGQLDLDLTGANTYSLYQNGLFLAGNLSSGMRKSPVLNANTGYKLIGRDANNCINTDSVTILVNPLPFKPAIYANKNYLQSNYSTGNQWFTGAVKIDTATSKTFYPPVNGSYAVEYTNAKGCKAISDDYDFRYYSLTSIDYSNVFKVYPNPSSGLFIFENLSNDILTIQVISSDGKLVYTHDNLQAGLNAFDLRGINSGLFVLKIYLNGGIFYSKIQVLQ